MAGLGVGYFETASRQGVHVINDGALEVICAKRIDQDSYSMNFAHGVIRAALVEHHAVLHAGTPAGFDVDPEKFVGIIGLVEERLDL